jgi:hypothetical protein
LAAESTDHTTPPMVDKADISSAEAPTTHALAPRSGSKAPNDTPVNDDPGLLNFTAMMPWIVGWTTFPPQKYCVQQEAKLYRKDEVAR